MEVKDIEELIQVLESSKVSEITLRKGDWGVTIRKGRPPVIAGEPILEEPAEDQSCALSPEIQEPCQPAEVEVAAPMVGIFHALEQGTKAGAQVQPGQIVGVIESMKLMNDVRTGTGGILTAVLAEDGTPVEYGQVLFRLKPSAAHTVEEES